MDAFTAVQLETSARCNLRCEMCPTLSYQDSFGIMREEVFDKFINDINSLHTLVLEGWGEPMLDQDLCARVRRSKGKAATVSFTTNATLLTKEAVQRFKLSGLDRVAVSCDGGTKEVYEKIRKGARFSDVINSIQCLIASGISVAITFVISKSNCSDLQNLIDLAHTLGVSQITVKPIDVVSSVNSCALQLTASELNTAYIEAAAYIQCKQYNITLCAWNIPAVPPLSDTCLAHPTRALFINYLGNVAPCCNLGHRAPRYLKSRQGLAIFSGGYISFGNIMDENIYAIWNKQEYVDFRSQIRRRQWPQACHLCNLKCNM